MYKNPSALRTTPLRMGAAMRLLYDWYTPPEIIFGMFNYYVKPILKNLGTRSRVIRSDILSQTENSYSQEDGKIIW